MTENNEFFFQSIQYSTQLYRETHKAEEFFIQQFFQEPNVTQLFVEIQPLVIEEEDSLFMIERKPSFRFPTQIQQKLVQLVTQTFQRKNSETQKIKKTEKTKKIKKALAQSEITKNACCNIVQKAISLIKNGQYLDKLQQLCQEFNVQIEQFRTYIISQRTRFTGTKALQIFLTQKSQINQLFSQFLRWFLQEKYIRHAIKSGQMSNMKAYIKFKNEVILPLLQ